MPSSISTKNKKPKDRQPKQYGRKWGSPLTDLDLPSGELAQVKRPGIQGLIKAGVLESLDTLTGIVQGETLPKAQGKPQANVEAIAKDPDKYNEMMATVDKIVLHCVVQPKVIEATVTEALILAPDSTFTQEDLGRDLEDDEKAILATDYSDSHNGNPLIFIDWIDEFDKMFIMNFVVGGSSDLEQFRAATQEAVGGASAVEAVSDESV